MGLVIKKHITRNGPGFRIQYEDRTNGRRHARDIPKEQWPNYGFRPGMAIEEARVRRDQLNLQERLKRKAQTQIAINAKQEAEDEIECAFLNPVDVIDFERKYLYTRPSQTKPKIKIHWRTCKRIIRKLQIDPEEWFELKHFFYDYFSANSYSVNYIRKLIQVLNLWGHYYCRQFRKAYLPIPCPKGIERNRINNAFRKKSNGGEASDPLTPALLEKNKSHFRPEQYHWLYLSVWFGLRPSEVDYLKTKYQVETNDKGVQLLHVYQPKLEISVKEEDRWKTIPCYQPEQIEGLRIIKYENVKRPLNKTIRNNIDPEITCYGGRKNFVDMMLGKGYPLEKISLWMGHKSIERTWRSYKKKLDY